jgi:Icc-related predicted phosphoesterase
MRSVPVNANEIRYGTIAADLERLAGEDDLRDSVFLFHTPPYRTALDRAALDGRMVDHVPMDVHVGSIAVRRFIEERQPLLTLHGHIHESARLTGAWRDRIGRTHLFSAAHDGPELCLVRFDLENPAEATRALI